jgi:hypothetical protein
MKGFAFGAAFNVAPGWNFVTNRQTLKMIERAGYIIIPPEYGKKGRSAIGPVIHRYVFEGEKAPALIPFKIGKREFRLTWSDGCFHPFVLEFKTERED